MELVDVQTVSSGEYRCETVADAPSFMTHNMAANMTIVGMLSMFSFIITQLIEKILMNITQINEKNNYNETCFKFICK